MAVITIFGGAFCQIEEVVPKVAQELGCQIIDEQILEEAARRFKTSREKLEKALVGPEPFFNKLTHEREKHVAWLRLVVAEMMQPDKVIVRGCLGHLIPRTISHVLRVCLIANHDYRVKTGMAQIGASEKEVGKLVHEDDKKNFACVEYLFEKPAYDEKLYDMVLAMHQSSVDDAAKVICEYAGSEPVATTDRSKRAAEDALLSAQINLALVENGLAADVHSEAGEIILSINEYVVRLERHRERLKEVAEKVPGVKSVSTRLGPKYKSKQMSPWSDLEGVPKVMLVDDEKEFVHTLSERLRTRSLDSSIAYDGEQALEMIEKDLPDVMVLDLMMPGIDGIEVLRRIKRDHPEVEVIILTGHGSDREKQLAEELGAFAYLNKPVDVDLLARVMREAYSRTGRVDDGSDDKKQDP
jgi:two-component system response regulator CpxR